ncbi:hypothetical protein PC9H_010079 [Pleurotus ostreatus]|uniref:Ubiquitin-like protease family profile domain-containing protein n=1 Tax=Pleurotus ostreatus TaxID=5322 RepID=A0A8H7DR86_PLEOS|nr:uncharacterized protein PC9H_010079 [Pleurotus ostreatus]KAF7424768.1 hypothetical protein PC9H_010079 [Pleurotus ostreatus]
MSNVQETNPAFSCKHWCRKHGPLYPDDPPPTFQKAQADALAIPNDVQELLPQPQLCVRQFTLVPLPDQHDIIGTEKASAWFSKDLPSTGILCLMDRPVPSKKTLQRIEEQTGKAWLNGANSIVDPRYNDGVDRFPLYALSFWKALEKIVEKQKAWKAGIEWLKDEERRADPLTCAVITGVIYKWFSTDHMDMAAEELALRIAQPSKTLVAPVAFANDLISAIEFKKSYSKQHTPLLCRYEREIDKKKLDKLYFPLHVNGNHWIAGFIDFKTRTFGYGSPVPKAFIAALRRWTKHLGKGTFREAKGGMRHGVQSDTVSCGIATFNTLAHAIIGDTLWTQSRGVRERILWFRRFCQHIEKDESSLTNNAWNYHPPTTRSFTVDQEIAIAIGDHNFSDLASFVAEPSTHVEGPPADFNTCTNKSDESGYEASTYEEESRHDEENSHNNGGDDGTWGFAGVDDNMSIDRPHSVELGWFDDGQFASPADVPAETEGMSVSELDLSNGRSSEDEDKGTFGGGSPVKLGQHSPKRAKARSLLSFFKPIAGIQRIKRLHSDSDGSDENASKSQPLAKRRPKKTKRTLAPSESTPSRDDYEDHEKWMQRLMKDDPHVEIDEKNHLLAPRTPTLFMLAQTRMEPALGGGARSVTVIAQEKFGKDFSKLSKKRKEEDAKNTPYIRFAEGVLAGQYQDFSVFTGLVEAMVMKIDRSSREVGLQNFRYAPAWDEFCHIINIHSPRAYQSLLRHLPGRTDRSFRQKESRQPRFPMKICDETFHRLKKQLLDLDYSGPVGLSCDDTKLLSSLRLYWNADEDSYYLVGSTDGPMRVTNQEEIKKMMADPAIIKADKLRLWSIIIPLPKVTPGIVFACLGIPTDLSADDLYLYLKKILDGLVENEIQVVSYACDGTEVERAVQHKLITECKDSNAAISYTIQNDNIADPVTVTIPIYQGQPIVMVQDSKHSLKTFRNNLFSGARLLTLGNYVAAYHFIRTIAFTPNSPLYHRDVEKLDRQDDSAAARLFSAATLEFIVHAQNPEYTGIIIYLFVFGELVDAYQNRNISHIERIKMALRARYFINSWKAYLGATGYRQAQHFLSREAVDIANIIVEGIIGLIIVYRDRVDGIVPLLPWLHSTEACEHTFAEARAIVKDFTLLDFLHMIPKLGVKMREAVFTAKVTGANKTANGYCHTYFDSSGIDLLNLTIMPSNHDIEAAAREAAFEADTLIHLLGIRSSMLHGLPDSHQPRSCHLPTINSWFVDEEEVSSDEEDSICDAEEFQKVIAIEDNHPVSRSNVEDDHLMSLSCTGVALAINDFIAVQSLPEPDPEDVEVSLMQESANIRAATALPGLCLPSEPTKPLGQGSQTLDDLDFSDLINLRRLHQTEHAIRATRTGREGDNQHQASLRSESMYSQLTRQFYAALKEDQLRGVTTGLGRAKRIENQGENPISGNASNAALAAESVTRKNAQLRLRLFSAAGFAGASLLHVKDATARFLTKQYVFLPSVAFLCRVPSPVTGPGMK